MTTTVDTPSNLDGARFELTPAGELVRCAPEAAVSPIVVDSWLVLDGTVRALAMHESRFRESCAALLPSLDSSTLEQFLHSVRSTLPRKGRWFPRIEAHDAPHPRLVLWIRDAPRREPQTRLWISGESDGRTRPLVKGPDLPALAALRARARLAGADDALLIAADGTVLEAAHSALVWWREERLCLPDAERSLLPSVTRALLLELARGRGVEIVRERVVAAELPELAMWTLNALHGIRPVSALHGSGTPESTPIAHEQVAGWSSAVSELAISIDDT